MTEERALEIAVAVYERAPAKMRERWRGKVTPPSAPRHRERCVHGHLMEGHNVAIRSNGLRQCRECLNRRGREYRAALKGKVS